MAILRNFHTQDLGNGESDVFALARDVIADRIFILCGQNRHDGESLQYSETTHSLADFLKETGTPQSELLELIGSLVVEE